MSAAFPVAVPIKGGIRKIKYLTRSGHAGSSQTKRHSPIYPVLPRRSACTVRRQRLITACSAASSDADGSGAERGEGWKIEAEASPLGDTLETKLSEQVEERAAGMDEGLAQTSSREVLEQQPAPVPAAARVRKKRKSTTVHQLLPSVEQQQPALSDGLKMGAIGVGVLVLTASIYYFGSKLVSAQLPKVQKAIEQKQLQKEAAQRLNQMIDELRNSQNADLSAKNLGEEGCCYISEGLAFNDRCIAADLSKNGIGKEGITALTEALKHNDVLQTLVLDTNSIGDEGAELLASYLSGNASIRRLNLGGNNIGDKGATVLAEMLKMNTTLTSLELNGNVIDYDGATALAEAITENTSLTALHLSDNYIGALGAAVLANALKKNKTLRELHMKGNELGNEGVGAICQALLERQSPISALDFGNNSITQEGAEWIAKVAEKAHLKELNLYMNDMGDAGIIMISKALEGDNSMTTLDVGGNNIGPEGITALAQALKGNDTLRTLELGYNPIMDKGAQALSDVAKYDLKVETLKMGWCKLGPDEGAKAVADLLMFNGTLVALDLRGNGLGNAGAAQLARALKAHTNDKLTELDLGYNEIKDEGACTLAQALKANPECAPRELKVNANYIGRFGQVALTEALDMVYEMAGGREIVITY